MRVSSVLIALVVLTGCGGAEPDVDAAPRGSSPPSSAPASPATSAAPATATPDDGAPSTAAGTTARAVYWVGATKDPRGPRLYREFVQRPESGDPVGDAVALMLSGEPSDPDYTSLWADGTTVRELRRNGTTLEVDLSEEAKTNGGGSAFEAATLQQLVHTVTAADTTISAVRLLVEGEPVETLWGSVSTSEPVSRAPAAETLGPVWLDVPDGGAISGDFGGTATVFEATVSWELRQGDRVAQDGFSTATEGAPGRGTWTGTADVPPGDYELWAYESSAKDGSVTWLDTKRVTVTG